MKNLILTFCAAFIAFSSFGQGLINDIMNVETVNIELTEENEKLKAEYEERLEKETADLDDKLAKIDEDYQEDVTKLITDFTKTLEDGEEQLVANQKKRTVSRVKSLTMTHKKTKKDAVQRFLNAMQIANRNLPDFLRQDAAKDVKDTASTHLETFDTDYKANLDAVKAFEKKEHLVISEGATTSTN